jgi:hypothetical protein
MDYGLFGTFEKIDANSYPRTAQERGLFLLELRFVSEGETRSVPVTWTVDRSRFGEVVRLGLPRASTVISTLEVSKARETLARATPPVQVTNPDEGDRLSFVFINEEGVQQKSYPGALIFDAQGQLATLLVRLHS